MSNKKEPTGKWVTEAQLMEALKVFRREHIKHDHFWGRFYGWLTRQRLS